MFVSLLRSRCCSHDNSWRKHLRNKTNSVLHLLCSSLFGLFFLQVHQVHPHHFMLYSDWLVRKCELQQQLFWQMSILILFTLAAKLSPFSLLLRNNQRLSFIDKRNPSIHPSYLSNLIIDMFVLLATQTLFFSQYEPKMSN